MADNPYGWWADNLPTVMALVFILLILLIVMIIYELWVFSKRPPEKKVVTEWQTSWSMELRTGAFRMGLVTLAFALMLFLEYLIYTNPQIAAHGLGNLLLVAMVFNIVIILGWGLMLGIPKNYAVMKDGVFSRGKFYPWRSIKEVSYSRFYHRIVLKMWNPFVGEIYMVSESPRKMAKKIEKHLDRAAGLRKKVPAKRPGQIIKKAPVKFEPGKRRKRSKKKRGKAVKGGDKKKEEKLEGEGEEEPEEGKKDTSQEEETGDKDIVTEKEEEKDMGEGGKEDGIGGEDKKEEEPQQKKEENEKEEEIDTGEGEEEQIHKTEGEGKDIEVEDGEDPEENIKERGEEKDDNGEGDGEEGEGNNRTDDPKE